MVETATTPTNALSAPLQEIARSYVAARARFGVALLEAAQHLAAARETCRHGEWHIFLDATRTSHDQAETLLAIHAQSQSDPAFADACRRGFLTFSAARELTSAPPEVREKALAQSNPPTVQQLRDEKRAANVATSRNLDQQAVQEIMPLALPPNFADVQQRLLAHDVTLTMEVQGDWLMFVTRYKGNDVGVVTPIWTNVVNRLSVAERQAAHAIAPALGQTGYSAEAALANQRNSMTRTGLLAAADPREEAIRLLKQLAPLMELIRTEDVEALAASINDLNECQEGTEALAWLGVGWALLDVEDASD